MSEMLTEEEAADLLSCSVSWLRTQRRTSDNPPPFHKIGLRLIRYDRVELLKWARSFDEEGVSTWNPENESD